MKVMTSETQGYARFLPVVLRAVFAGAAMWFLFAHVDPALVFGAIGSAQLVWLIAAACLVPVHLALRALRWHLLLRNAGIMFSFSYTFGVVLAGYAFSAVTPGEVGDFFVRSRFHGGSKGGTIPALVLADKITQMITIMAAGIPAVAYVFLRSWTLSIALFIACCLFVAGLAGARAWLLQRMSVRRIAERFGLTGGIEALSSISRTTVLQVMTLSAGMLSIYAVQDVLLLNALDQVPVTVGVLGYLSSMLVLLVLPFSLAGIGIREGSHVYFFGLLHVSAVVALSASLLLFTVNVLIPSLVGLIVFLFLPKRTFPPA